MICAPVVLCLCFACAARPSSARRGVDRCASRGPGRYTELGNNSLEPRFAGSSRNQVSVDRVTGDTVDRLTGDTVKRVTGGTVSF